MSDRRYLMIFWAINRDITISSERLYAAGVIKMMVGDQDCFEFQLPR